MDKELARKIIVDAVENISKAWGYTYNRIFIKNQRTRLGSCSSLRNLNFNWQIAKFPKEVMEYVIKHELAHLKHFNHSRNFWDEVERLDPDYKVHEKWLKEKLHDFIKFRR